MATFYCAEYGCPQRWENRRLKAKRPKCCGVPMAEVRKLRPGFGTGVTATPDITPHFNPSLDQFIGSRRELRIAQAATGSVDYEPSKKQKERDAAARDRMKFEASRR